MDGWINIVIIANTGHLVSIRIWVQGFPCNISFSFSLHNIPKREMPLIFAI